jgi:hypothetical protein
LTIVLEPGRGTADRRMTGAELTAAFNAYGNISGRWRATPPKVPANRYRKTGEGGLAGAGSSGRTPAGRRRPATRPGCRSPGVGPSFGVLKIGGQYVVVTM